MVVYISGTITGTEDYWERFCKAEDEILERGFYDEDVITINPSKILSGLPKGTSHEVYMSVALKLLNLADIMVLLDGWEESEGCKQELKFAQTHEIEVFSYNEFMARNTFSLPKRDREAYI